MSPKIFITGVTGYIGGDFLYLLQQKHSDWETTCLVRNSDKGAKVAAVYSAVRLVYGDLDAVDLIEEEASQADIVYHFANCDHMPSAHAITRGLSRRARPGPGFWIHTSGTMILATETINASSYGELTSKVFNDWDGVSELITLPEEAAHRHVDKIVLAASSDKIQTAIVCPPTIYGPGRGPDNTRSMQVYNAAELFLKRQQAFKLGKGQNIWHEIHVQDLSELYLLIGEAAASGGPPATWNDQGYYLAENGSFVWGDILSSVAKIASEKGYLPNDEVSSFSNDEADQIHQRLKKMVGTTSRGESYRGKRLLGWSPKQRRLQDELEDIVEDEARKCGVNPGHAAKVGQMSRE